MASESLESADGVPVAPQRSLAVLMPAGGDLDSAAEDVAHGSVIGREDPGVDHGVPLGRREGRMLAVEHDDVGPVARRNRTDPSPERLLSPGASRLVEPPAGRAALLSEHIPAAMPQALRVVEGAQFFG